MPTVENSFQYRGDLSQTALPEILYTIDRFQVPGVIEASREGIVKQVYIKEGNVVHATSTDREDSLGSYLQRSGIISPELYLETMRERERTNKRYGVLLIENGVLSPAEVYRADPQADRGDRLEPLLLAGRQRHLQHRRVPRAGRGAHPAADAAGDPAGDQARAGRQDPGRAARPERDGPRALL